MYKVLVKYEQYYHKSRYVQLYYPHMKWDFDVIEKLKSDERCRRYNNLMPYDYKAISLPEYIYLRKLSIMIKQNIEPCYPEIDALYSQIMSDNGNNGAICLLLVFIVGILMILNTDKWYVDGNTFV